MQDFSAELERAIGASFVRRVEAHRVLASTNDRAMELAGRHPLETPVLILAEEQTAGRGRGANRWWAGPGALTFSLVIEPELADIVAEHWPRVSLATGLSVCEVLQDELPHVECGLKWPNDVWLAGRKVCGILVEIPPARAGVPRRMVIGIGLNVNNSLAEAPDDVQARATSLCDSGGRPFDVPSVLLQLLLRIEQNLESLAAHDPQLGERWQRACTLRGRPIEVQLGERTLRGIARGIQHDGSLLVDVDGREERLWGGVLTLLE